MADAASVLAAANATASGVAAMAVPSPYSAKFATALAAAHSTAPHRLRRAEEDHDASSSCLPAALPLLRGKRHGIVSAHQATKIVVQPSHPIPASHAAGLANPASEIVKSDGCSIRERQVDLVPDARKAAFPARPLAATRTARSRSDERIQLLQLRQGELALDGAASAGSTRDKCAPTPDSEAIASNAVFILHGLACRALADLEPGRRRRVSRRSQGLTSGKQHADEPERT